MSVAAGSYSHMLQYFEAETYINIFIPHLCPWQSSRAVSLQAAAAVRSNCTAAESTSHTPGAYTLCLRAV
jgi:hypothetical protein